MGFKFASASVAVVGFGMIVSGCAYINQIPGKSSAKSAINYCPASAAVVVGSFQSGTGTDAAPFAICNQNQLSAMVTYCAGTSDSCFAKTFIVGADIDLTSLSYNPPANFRGTFDGNGKTISNWSYTAANLADSGATIEADIGNAHPHVDFNLGFFRVLDNGGIVKNLTLTNVSLRGRYFTGALVGNMLAGSLVDNCRATTNGLVANVTTAMSGIVIGYNDLATGGSSGRTGGLVGENEIGSTVSNSSFDGLVRGAMAVGGLVGLQYGNVSGSQTSGGLYGRDGNNGGITGVLSGATAVLSNSSSSMTVRASSNVTGGIAGSTDSSTTITGCSFTGSVIANSLVGGIVGWADTATISKCSSNGTVIGAANVGGLIGAMQGSATLSDSWSRSPVTFNAVASWGGPYAAGGAVGAMSNAANSVTRVYAVAAITNNYGVTAAWGDLIGGGVGSVTNSYADDANSTSGIIGTNTMTITASSSLTTAAMKAQYTGWDYADVWKISASSNSGFPELK